MRSLVDVYPTAHYFGGFLINVANSIQFKRHKGDSSLFVVRELNSKETPPSLHRIQGVYIPVETAVRDIFVQQFLWFSHCLRRETNQAWAVVIHDKDKSPANHLMSSFIRRLAGD